MTRTKDFARHTLLFCFFVFLFVCFFGGLFVSLFVLVCLFFVLFVYLFCFVGVLLLLFCLVFQLYELIACKQQACWWAHNYSLYLYFVLNKLLFKPKPCCFIHPCLLPSSSILFCPRVPSGSWTAFLCSRVHGRWTSRVNRFSLCSASVVSCMTAWVSVSLWWSL